MLQQIRCLLASNASYSSMSAISNLVHVASRPEPIMLKILPYSFQNFSLFFILVSSLLFHNNAHLVSVASHLVFKMLM